MHCLEETEEETHWFQLRHPIGGVIALPLSSAKAREHAASKTARRILAREAN